MDEFKAHEANVYESNILTQYLNQVLNFITSYGWYLFGLGLLTLYLRPYIEDKLDKWQRERELKQFEAKCKKDPNFLEGQRQAIENARKKMQVEHDRKAEEYMQKMKEKEEKKRQELLSQPNSGYRLGDQSDAFNTSSNGKKKSWKPEYNPLMGSSSVSYRPPKRGCPGGSCG